MNTPIPISLMKPVTICVYKPETQVARSTSTIPGAAVLMTMIRMPEGFAPYQNLRLLEPHEMHCPYDPEWLAEHLAVLWKEVGDALLQGLPDIHTVDVPSAELCDQVKELNAIDEEEAEEETEEDE